MKANTMVRLRMLEHALPLGPASLKASQSCLWIVTGSRVVKWSYRFLHSTHPLLPSDGTKREHERRLEALQRHLICDPATLFFEDGTSAQISGRGDFIGQLFAAALRGERTPQIKLIARSVRSEEPGGGHLLDLARALLNGPADVQQTGC